MNLMAIDPGTHESAYVICDYGTLKPIDKAKIPNAELLEQLPEMIMLNSIQYVGIEYMQSYGMGVGKETFETCYFIGRMTERILRQTAIKEIIPIYRNEEKIGTVGNMRANDTAIRNYLIDTFAAHDFKTGKGTKGNPDWFYGFSKDMWQAYAQAYILKLKVEGKM